MAKLLKYIISIFLIAGIAIGIFAAVQKNAIEKVNNKIEIVMDFDDLRKLSLMEGVDFNDLIQKFAEAGITSLSISEKTLDQLQETGKIFWLTGYEKSFLDKVSSSKNKEEKNSKPSLKQNISLGKRPNSALLVMYKDPIIKPYFSYVISNNKESLSDTEKQLQNYLGKNRVVRIKNDTLQIIDDEEDLSNLGLTIPKEDIIIISKLHLNFIPRIKNNYRLNGEILSNKLKYLSEYASFDKVIFDGEEVGGYKNNIESVANALLENNINYGYLEMTGQKGDIVLLNTMKNRIVRVHSIPEDEMQKKMTLQNAIDRFERAFLERGVRVLFIRPFSTPFEGNNLIQNNLDYVKEIKSTVVSNGFSPIKTSTINQISLSQFFTFILALSMASALCILLNNFFVKNTTTNYAILFLTAISSIILLKTQPILLNKTIALLSAIIFPTISMTYFAKINKKRGNITISFAIFSVLIAFLIALVGALFVVASLLDTSFITGAKQFVGVKIAFVVPILLIIYFIFKQIGENKKLLDLLATPLTIGMFFAALIFGLAAAVYILRSGNFGIGVLDIERVFRDFIQNALIVRPRTKEFLIGYPALFLSAMYFLKRTNFAWIFFVIGTIGPISTINTFCHAHSPFLISLLRSFYGVILGIFLGIIYFVIIQIFIKTTDNRWKF